MWRERVSWSGIQLNQWMNAAKEAKIESLWGTLPPLPQATAVLEARQTSYTTWTSCSTIFPNDSHGHRHSYRAADNSNEPPSIRSPSTLSLRGYPIKHQSRKRWPRNANQVLQFNKQLLNPRDESGTPLDAEDDIKREKRKRPCSQGSHNLEGKGDEVISRRGRLRWVLEWRMEGRHVNTEEAVVNSEGQLGKASLRSGRNMPL